MSHVSPGASQILQPGTVDYGTDILITVLETRFHSLKCTLLLGRAGEGGPLSGGAEDILTLVLTEAPTGTCGLNSGFFPDGKGGGLIPR